MQKTSWNLEKQKQKKKKKRKSEKKKKQKIEVNMGHVTYVIAFVGESSLEKLKT